MTFDLEVLGTNGYGKIFLLKNVILKENEIPFLNSFIKLIEKIEFLIIEQVGGFETLILTLYNENSIFESKLSQEFNKVLDNLIFIKNNLIFNKIILNKIIELNSIPNNLIINEVTFKNNLIKHFNFINENIEKYKYYFKFLRNENTIDLFDFNLNEFRELYKKFIIIDELNSLDKIEKNDFYKLFYKSRFLFFDDYGEIIFIPLYLNEGILKSNSNFLRALEELIIYKENKLKYENTDIKETNIIEKFLSFFKKD